MMIFDIAGVSRTADGPVELMPVYRDTNTSLTLTMFNAALIRPW